MKTSIIASIFIFAGTLFSFAGTRSAGTQILPAENRGNAIEKFGNYIRKNRIQRTIAGLELGKATTSEIVRHLKEQSYKIVERDEDVPGVHGVCAFDFKFAGEIWDKAIFFCLPKSFVSRDFL